MILSSSAPVREIDVREIDGIWRMKLREKEERDMERCGERLRKG